MVGSTWSRMAPSVVSSTASEALRKNQDWLAFNTAAYRQDDVWSVVSQSVLPYDAASMLSRAGPEEYERALSDIGSSVSQVLDQARNVRPYVERRDNPQQFYPSYWQDFCTRYGVPHVSRGEDTDTNPRWALEHEWVCMVFFGGVFHKGDGRDAGLSADNPVYFPASGHFGFYEDQSGGWGAAKRDRGYEWRPLQMNGQWQSWLRVIDGLTSNADDLFSAAGQKGALRRTWDAENARLARKGKGRDPDYDPNRDRPLQERIQHRKGTAKGQGKGKR